MRVTVIQPQTKRKRLDRPVRRTEKQGRRASTARSRGSIRPIRVVSATADTARGKKRLIGWPRWAILRSNGKPLGECRLEVKWQATWGMSVKMISETYDKAYYLSHCGIPYHRDEPHWYRFFGDVARGINQTISPKTVFDAGCAIGFLVETLREQGIEAFGRDISRYAIDQVPVGLKAYVEQGSISDPIDGTFDLVTCIEVLEHMSADEGRKAIENLCRTAPKVLFSSSPNDFTEETHINVQPPIYWMRLFADFSFGPLAHFDGSFLCPWAILFERCETRPTDKELEAHARLIQAKLDHVEALRRAHEGGRDQITQLNAHTEQQAAQIAALYNELLRTRTRPMRSAQKLVQFHALTVLSKISAPISQRRSARFANSAAKRDPSRPFLVKAQMSEIEKEINYDYILQSWSKQRAAGSELYTQLLGSLRDGPLISLAVPVYNPDPSLLSEMIESVLVQSYPNWELCMADDCSTDNRIAEILRSYAEKDKRIRVIFREENGHISRATNTAINICNGRFIALLDHDDLLDPDALLWVSKVIRDEPSARIIYTDEDKVREDGSRYEPHFKPDWNRDLLYCCNYVSHLGVYETSLLREVGGFREGFEGAQDHDLLLRCLEKVSDSQIVHIPKVLYSWRATPGSTAASRSAKPYTDAAGQQAIAEHLKRATGHDIAVDRGPVPFTYRAQWAVHGNPLVSIIIPTRDHLDVLKVAVDSILSKTDHTNFELIVVDNGSVEQRTLEWFDQITAQDRRVRILRDDRPFNYSALNNAAVAQSSGEFVALVNNDIKVISPGWLSEMVALAQRSGTGCVGAKLYYPDGRIQHAGVVIGIGGVAGHAHLLFPGEDLGYFARLGLRQNYTAVTGACLVVRRSIYDEVEGLNETDLAVAFNDVDFCLKVDAAGYRNVWTPFAELVHHESISRGYEDTPEKQERFRREVDYMKRRWDTHVIKDPAYNPNLTLDRNDFGFGPANWGMR